MRRSKMFPMVGSLVVSAVALACRGQDASRLDSRADGVADGPRSNHALAVRAEPERAGVVNGEPVPHTFLESLEARYSVRVADGSYWYDGRSGAYGLERGPALGFTLPALDWGGPLRPKRGSIVATPAPSRLARHVDEVAGRGPSFHPWASSQYRPG